MNRYTASLCPVLRTVLCEESDVLGILTVLEGESCFICEL